MIYSIDNGKTDFIVLNNSIDLIFRQIAYRQKTKPSVMRGSSVQYFLS